MTSAELLALLQDFYRERAALMLRHIAVARHVGNLDFNNTYQYVINREDNHLAWVRAAVEELGGVAPSPGDEPTIQSSKSTNFVSNLIADDARGNHRGKARFGSHVSLSGGVSVLSIDVYHGINRKNAKYRIVPTCAMRVSVLVGVCMPR